MSIIEKLFKSGKKENNEGSQLKFLDRHIDNSSIIMDYLVKTLANIHEIDGREFEKFMNELFIFSGYDTNLTPPKGDGGIDLYVTKDNITTAIQLKKRKLDSTSLIGVEEVRKLLGAINIQDSKLQGAIITNHYYTEYAKEEAQKANIELIDKEGLITLISTLQPNILAKVYYEKIIEPLGKCPKCGNINIYRYNPKIGKKYSLCIDYPKCKG